MAEAPNRIVIAGPREGFDDVESVLNTYHTIGFQASHYAEACHIAAKMLQPQPPSTVFALHDGVFVPVAPPETSAEDPPLVRPTLFLGLCANLLGTGCREAVRFLLQEGVEPWPTSPPTEDRHRLLERWGITGLNEPPHGAVRSFLHALVVSGGAVEHDIRRACRPYVLTQYDNALLPRGGPAVRARFGNVEYADDVPPTLFQSVMEGLVARLTEGQARLRLEAARHPPREAYDDVCTWALTPSDVWALAGWWLPSLMEDALRAHRGGPGDPANLPEEALQRAQETVVYWAARQDVPIFSPSFVDGDIMSFLLASSGASPRLALDLVRDIHGINKLAMLSQRSGMLICGGGVVKHHICNANLMRNGADYTILLNNSQEFDGSDAGARPEEAVSWGKVRLDGEAVKVYGEITTMFPLLVGQVFLPAARAFRRAQASPDATSSP